MRAISPPHTIQHYKLYDRNEDEECTKMMRNYYIITFNYVHTTDTKLYI